MSHKQPVKYLIIIAVVIIAVAVIFVIRNNSKKVDNSTAIQPVVNEEDKELDWPPRLQVLGISTADHALGASEAPVEVIVYHDYDCLFCAQFAGPNGSLAEARNFFGDNLKIAFRHNPLSFHAFAQFAAEASECANEQGKFWEMHNLLIKDKIDNNLNSLQIFQNAEEIPLDTAEFQACLEDGRYKDVITTALKAAAETDVNSAPTSFINGYLVLGATPFADYETEAGWQPGLKTIIEQALQEISR